MRLRTVALVAITFASSAVPHDVISTKLTWSRDVSRIVYKHCAQCHRIGRSAMSLITYQDSRPWAKAIKEEVLSRRMPPWGAVKGFGDFRNDNSLSQEEMNVIANWVEGGAPEGDANLLPPLPAVATSVAAQLSARITCQRRTVLDHDVSIIGIAPSTSVAENKAIATKPDGSVVPLIWLHNYKRPGCPARFEYLEPLELPKGTVITATEPGLSLVIATRQPAH